MYKCIAVISLKVFKVMKDLKKKSLELTQFERDYGDMTIKCKVGS